MQFNDSLRFEDYFPNLPLQQGERRVCCGEKRKVKAFEEIVCVANFYNTGNFQAETLK
jgi:hypothetical protein